MQDKAQKAAKTAAAPPPGRSSLAKLPAELRQAVNRAVAKGATVDDIAALIRAEGESGSRSAAGRDAKDMRGLVRTRQEADRIVKSWMQAHGERPQDEMALVLIQSLRAMALATMERMTEREEPVSMEELARFSVVVKRIESTDELRRRREQAAAKAAEAAKPKPRRGISPETEAYIRSKVQGEPFPPRRPVTSVPIDPWAPDETRPTLRRRPARSRRLRRRPARSRRRSLDEDRSGRDSHQLHVDPLPWTGGRCGRACGRDGRFPEAAAVALRAARRRRRRSSRPRKGLSPEASIRPQAQGHPFPPRRPLISAPIDPRNPAESHFIPQIPANPARDTSCLRLTTRPVPLCPPPSEPLRAERRPDQAASMLVSAMRRSMARRLSCASSTETARKR